MVSAVAKTTVVLQQRRIQKLSVGDGEGLMEPTEPIIPPLMELPVGSRSRAPDRIWGASQPKAKQFCICNNQVCLQFARGRSEYVEKLVGLLHLQMPVGDASFSSSSLHPRTPVF